MYASPKSKVGETTFQWSNEALTKSQEQNYIYNIRLLHVVVIIFLRMLGTCSAVSLLGVGLFLDVHGGDTNIWWTPCILLFIWIKIAYSASSQTTDKQNSRMPKLIELRNSALEPYLRTWGSLKDKTQPKATRQLKRVQKKTAKILKTLTFQAPFCLQVNTLFND